MKMMVAVMILASMPATAGKNNVAYPSGKLAEFVVEKVNVRSLPEAIQSEASQGKKDAQRLWICDAENR